MEIIVIILCVLVFIQGWMINRLSRIVSENLNHILTLQKSVLGLYPEEVVMEAIEKVTKEGSNYE